MLATFLLEELMVRLREHADPRVRTLGVATACFLDEVDMAARALAGTLQ
jgi:DNA-binding PucR family transcriptional regulator